MSLTIPEIVLQNTVDNIIAFIKADWDATIDKTQTAIYDMFNGTVHGNYDYYEQAQNIFLKTDADTRKVKILPSYPRDKSRFPCIIINTPSQQTGGEDGLGFDYNKGDVFYNDDDLEYTENYSRSFTGNYSVIVYSDNKEEVQLVYYALQAFFILLSDHLEHSGFKNLKISGREIQMLPKDIGDGIFVRALQVNGHTNQTVKNYLSKSMVQNFTFSGTPVESSIEF